MILVQFCNSSQKTTEVACSYDVKTESGQHENLHPFPNQREQQHDLQVRNDGKIKELYTGCKLYRSYLAVCVLRTLSNNRVKTGVHTICNQVNFMVSSYCRKEKRHKSVLPLPSYCRKENRHKSVLPLPS